MNINLSQLTDMQIEKIYLEVSTEYKKRNNISEASYIQSLDNKTLYDAYNGLSISVAKLPKRTMKALRLADIYTINDLFKRIDNYGIKSLYRIRGMGKEGLRLIKIFLNSIRFKYDINYFNYPE